MMNDIVVNDTNIFIDLISVGLLEEAFSLSLKFHTVDYVVAEIVDSNQKQKIVQLIDEGFLFVKEFDAGEFAEIIDMYEKSNTNVSVADCSVWYYAKKNNCRLLTGDGKLRNSATNDGVLVSGILYITDMLVEYGIVSKKDMSFKLMMLLTINKRLPKTLIEDRIISYTT